ncbi:MAG: hypothetical protein VB108_11785 [Anaerolineaceae bacterium]|nr:hypothetical protein [Anaerolineaceae bacterium]
MTNFELHQNCKIDLEKDFYAYIDESGDEGFDLGKAGVTYWFNVSAIVATPSEFSRMNFVLQKYHSERKINKPIYKLSSKELDHNRKKDLFQIIGSFRFITIHSLFYKPRIDLNDRLVRYPSMYFVGVKNVIERLSWLTKQYGKQKCHIVVSGRNNIKESLLREYLFKYSIIGQSNLTYQEKIGKVTTGNISQHTELLYADYAAYSMRIYFEESGMPPSPDQSYFRWFQKNKLYSSQHSKFKGVWTNGLKLTPNDKNIKYISDILDEGSHS